MLEMKSDIPADAFSDFLIGQISFYDQAILKDITPSDRWINPRPHLDHLFEDARFLPSRLVSVFILHSEKPNLKSWHIAKRLGLKRKTVEKRLDLAWDIIDDSLKDWLRTLPKNERRRERYKRLKSWRRQRRPWFPVNETLDRFRAVWPNITATDLKSDWPPPSKLNCVGEPCDPQSPMRHWDD